MQTAWNGSDQPKTVETVETPTSPSSSVVLSRFEFETGKGNDGTKILMVEWDSSAAAGAGPGADVGAGADNSGCNKPRHDTGLLDEWSVTWDGKTSSNALATHNVATEDGTARRVYFLLPSGTHIPPLVTIGGGDVALRTKPLPAIYPSGLGQAGHDAGKRGVLHTLWAKQRLADLEAEIEAEMKTNSESIGLQIAIQEHEWITGHFGVGDPAGPKKWSPYLPSPQSPTPQAGALSRSPIGGKLGEKLRGLKLATSPTDLVAAAQASKAAAYSSRPVTGKATASLSGFHARSANLTSIDPLVAGGMSHSLDAVVQGDHAAKDKAVENDAANTEDELFALPLSPRSPDMAKSPFSLL